MKHVGSAILIALFSLAASAQSPTSFQLHGFLTGRAVSVRAQPSWTEGGVGRFDVGADSKDDRATEYIGLAQIGADWMPTSWLTLHADGLARREPQGTGGSRAGLVQGFADVYNEHWRLRVGTFWLPTSRENVDPMWNSPYTITYSALNTWIGEEVRPVGADLQFSPSFYLTLGVTGIRGNDTMGTELAAHGWTFGNRISLYNEDLPVPLGEETRPVGADLDHKWGHSERIRVQLPERANLQVTHIDNRALLTPELGGYEPWQTRFDIIGGAVGTSSPTTVAGEWSRGWTAVRFPSGSRFTIDFEAGYILLSHKSGPTRWTVRADRFSTKNHVFRAVDNSKESGRALTLAWLRDAGPHLRAGLEYVRVEGDRPGAARRWGFDPETGGSTITVELRYSF